ncbi:MAG: DNA mismatch repair protein MutS [Candidatus Marinimicrobia bacterium]|nr:DNA mismatch repair protein MutS [Candidatus Neomarinimicrobiota bacterium]
MRQYYNVKTEYPDALVLFRMGDFYETFEDDAKTAARVLNITLTKRANGKASSVPLAGFPYHALESHLYKLMKAGLKVAICEQVEDPKTAKGIVRREVVEIVTPGTSISTRFLEDKNNNYLLAVNIDKNIAGVSVIDVSTGEFFVQEFPVSNLKERILSYSPTEVLCPEKIENEIMQLIGSQVLKITPLDPWMFHYEEAYSALTEHFQTQSLKGFGIVDLKPAVQSAGAILLYLRFNHQKDLAHIDKISVETDKDVMIVDNFTRKNLEIFTTLQSQGRDGSLIHVLDKTITSLGSRQLKKWLLRPLFRVSKINERLDQVEALASDNLLRDDIREKLQECSDLERLLAKLSTNRSSARDLVQIKTTFEILPQITILIKNLPVFTPIFENFDSLPELVALINKTLATGDLPLSIKDGGFIADGLNAELDEYRYMMRHGKQWIANLQASEREKLNIPSLKIGYNKVFGYFIEVRRLHTEKIPENYIRKQTLVNCERYITPELKEYEEKLLHAEEKVSILEYQIFQDLRLKILDRITEIQKNAHLIATLDILASLADIAVRNHYIRPEINQGSEILIKEGRHPVVEELLPAGEKFTPNDLEIDNNVKQIYIITGPNMSGKSTYLRQIGLIVLMAQIGSFVPASEARIGVVDRIFTRVGASDNLTAGESTFLMEMNETANILNNATPKSLVLLDEIGRGTSTYDGMSIAWAVTEYLHNHETTAAKTLFATHYHELTELEKLLPRVGNLNVAVKEYGNTVAFLRKILPGGCDRSYGIHVAKMAGVPDRVIHRANEIMANFNMEKRDLPTNPETFHKIPEQNPNQLSLFDRKESELRRRLQSVDINNLTPLEALRTLDELKHQFGE